MAEQVKLLLLEASENLQQVLVVALKSRWRAQVQAKSLLQTAAGSAYP
jgi:hypothetical protein